MAEKTTSGSGVMEIENVADAINWQADYCVNNGALNTARLVRGLLAVLDTDTATGRRMANWQGLSIEDALPLRVAGAFRYLFLSGEEPRLDEIYQGLMTDQSLVDDLVAETARTFDHVLLPWLDRPPQTNEAARSAAVMASLLWLSAKIGSKFDLNEIGASAGINTMMGRLAFDLGGVHAGPSLSSLKIAPEWRGADAAEGNVEIVGAQGCDISPVDLGDPDQAMRLKSYIWPEATERLARLDTAIAMAERMPPEITRQDALSFILDRLQIEQQDGVTKVIFHTIVWQYLPAPTRAQITAAIEEAGAKATADKPLAWIAVEPNRDGLVIECTARFWPGWEKPTVLGVMHPHGAWLDWKAPPSVS